MKLLIRFNCINKINPYLYIILITQLKLKDMKSLKLSIATPKKGQVKETLTNLVSVDKHEKPNFWNLHVKFNNGDVATLNVYREQIIEWYDWNKQCKRTLSEQNQYWINFVNDRVVIENGNAFLK